MLEAVQRPNIYSETLGPDQFGIIQKPLTLVEKIYNQTWLRKISILVVLALAPGKSTAAGSTIRCWCRRSAQPCTRWSPMSPTAPSRTAR